MPDETEFVLKAPLDIQDYLDASSHAAGRTRSACIVVVVASVLVFAGLLNSLQHSWLLQRLRASNPDHSSYVATKIGSPPISPDLNSTEWRHYEIRYREFYSALSRTYADSSYIIRVPFFGFTVDANDLGLLGGISFVVILVMLRLCISREVGNLHISFKKAEGLGRLSEFYNLLAMQQVFTVPPGTITRDSLLLWVPKLFFSAPLTVHLAVVAHDFATIGIGRGLSDTHALIVLVCEVGLAIVIAALTGMVLTRLRRLDDVWLEYWQKVERAK
jgi:hypothetical protein